MMQTGNDESLAFYPIRTLSALTGVNARTIRAWERRYELLTPFRTDSGHRLYTDEHVKTIKEVVRLLEQGVPISRVKPLLNQPAALKIHGEESRLMKHESEWPAFRETLVAATLKRDLHGMEKTCREVLERYPFDVVLRYLLIPTRNELLTQHSAEYYSLFDFILAEKLLHKIVSNFPADAIAKILVASNRPSAVGVEFLSFCWALASQKMMPLPFTLGMEALWQLSPETDAVLIYLHEMDMTSPHWEALQQFIRRATVPIFVAGIFDKEMLAFLRNLGAVPLHEDARKSAILIADILSTEKNQTD